MYSKEAERNSGREFHFGGLEAGERFLAGFPGPRKNVPESEIISVECEEEFLAALIRGARGGV